MTISAHFPGIMSLEETAGSTAHGWAASLHSLFAGDPEPSALATGLENQCLSVQLFTPGSRVTGCPLGCGLLLEGLQSKVQSGWAVPVLLSQEQTWS